MERSSWWSLLYAVGMLALVFAAGWAIGSGGRQSREVEAFWTGLGGAVSMTVGYVIQVRSWFAPRRQQDR